MPARRLRLPSAGRSAAGCRASKNDVEGAGSLPCRRRGQKVFGSFPPVCPSRVTRDPSKTLAPKFSTWLSRVPVVTDHPGSKSAKTPKNKGENPNFSVSRRLGKTTTKILGCHFSIAPGSSGIADFCATLRSEMYGAEFTTEQSPYASWNTRAIHHRYTTMCLKPSPRRAKGH